MFCIYAELIEQPQIRNLAGIHIGGKNIVITKYVDAVVVYWDIQTDSSHS